MIYCLLIAKEDVLSHIIVYVVRLIDITSLWFVSCHIIEYVIRLNDYLRLWFVSWDGMKRWIKVDDKTFIWEFECYKMV